jgi:prepilin-type N-terminal cleavage/methylation domain-containing protein
MFRQKLKKSRKLFRGFTLIEILVVVTIIGILSVLVIVNTQDTRAKARNAKRKADLHSISSGLETYYADNNGYPFSEGLVFVNTHRQVRNAAISATARRSCNFFPGQAGQDCVSAGGGWLWELASTGYIDQVPVDPINIAGAGFTGTSILLGTSPTAQPGLMYIYLNDETNSGNGNPNQAGNNARCYSGNEWDIGHGQTYKLLAALERPAVDRDWVGDGGSYPNPGAANPDAFSVDLGTTGGVNLGGVRIGMMYEVYSAGGSQSFAGFHTAGIINMGHLQPGRANDPAAAFDPNFCY